jgi:alginate O-acetyltransferase complex protein AlgI
MTFNSWAFLFFFPIVTSLYFALPYRWRWLLLLIASCVFYMAFIPAYILILLFTIAVDYVAGLLIERSAGAKRRAWLICSLVANIGVLAVFKYGNFASANFAHIAHLLDLRYPAKVIDIILPIGLSFHTFQAMSYTIEVYRGNQRAERHLGIYALYVMFYPQLVAGPIERPQNLLHQFHEPHAFDGDRVADGLGRMLWGLFKKIVIADRLAIIVNTVYAKPQDFSGIVLLLATYCFAVQIYTDFSAYSDIALGAARVMGITLMENFDRPYLSTSMAEFWRRWHISLSTWFRDYLYIPLGGNRVSTPRWCFNIMLVFLLSGLWHGANWTYVIWGALHGFYLLFGRFTKPARQWLSHVLRLDRHLVARDIVAMLITIQLTTFAWVFFRADNFSQAIFILGRVTTATLDALLHIPQTLQTVANLYVGPIGNKFLQLTLWLLIAAGLVHLLRRPGSITRNFDGRPAWLRWAASYAVIAGILLLGIFGSQSFIYFQF